MEDLNLPGATPAPAPAATPAVPAVEIPATPPAATPAPVVMQEPKKKFLDGVSMTDVIVGIGVVTALTLVCYYYYHKSKRATGEFAELRAELNDMKKRIEEEAPEQQPYNQFGN